MKHIKYIVVHCSDSPDDRDTVNAEEIHKWHLQNPGWDGIGYHFVILRNGALENGRPIYWQGAHVKKVNNCSLGICLVGRRSFSDEQFCQLRKTILLLKQLYPDAKVKGHYEFDSSKTCPNFDVEKWWDDVQGDQDVK